MSYIQPFADASGFRARFEGSKGTATKAVDANTPKLTNIDFKILEERYMNGIHLILKNHKIEDDFNLQIVDKDGVGVTENWYTQAEFDAMGNIYVADQFGTNWNVNEDVQTQHPVILNYPAKLKVGLYVRIAYTANGTVDDVMVCANHHLHKQG